MSKISTCLMTSFNNILCSTLSRSRSIRLHARIAYRSSTAGATTAALHLLQGLEERDLLKHDLNYSDTLSSESTIKHDAYHEYHRRG